MCTYIALRFNNKYSLCFRILCNSIYIERTIRCLLSNPTLKKNIPIPTIPTYK